MRIIPVEPYPLREVYSSFEEGIAGALRDPLQPQAQADTAKLLGARVADAWWTDSDCVIRFSNERLLHIWVVGPVVRWVVLDTTPELPGTVVERIGAPAIICRWPALGDEIWDRSALATKRVGSEFVRLFVTSGALLVYCRGQLIWWFSAAHREDMNLPMLHVTEDE